MGYSPLKAVLIYHIRLNPKARGHNADERSDKYADNSYLLCQYNRKHKVNRNLKKRLISIIPIEPHCISEYQYNLSHTADIKVEDKYKNYRQGKYIFFARPRFHKRIVYYHHTYADVTVYPKAKKLQHVKYSEQAFLVFLGIEVADTCGCRTEYAHKSSVNACTYHKVIGINSDTHDTDKA